MRLMHGQPPIFWGMVQIVVSDAGTTNPVDDIAKGLGLGSARTATLTLKQGMGLQQRSVFHHGQNVLDSLVFMLMNRGVSEQPISFPSILKPNFANRSKSTQNPMSSSISP